jgi:hypothetical protein
MGSASVSESGMTTPRFWTVSRVHRVQQPGDGFGWQEGCVSSAHDVQPSGWASARSVSKASARRLG